MDKTWLAVVLLFTSVLTAEEPLERIGIQASEDGAQFILKESGSPFFVKGFNYVRLRAAARKAGGDHATFDADTKNTKAHYDPERSEAMFSALSKAGYNTVRVFIIGRSRINPGIAGDYDSTKTLHEPYMENVLDFLRRATRHRIRVFPTFGDGGVPLNAYYRERVRGKGHNKNVFVLTKEGIDARVEHITTVLRYIKDRDPTLLPTLLGLQCQNEAYLRANQWPFTETEGMFTAPNGKTYDLSKTDERQALMDEGYHHYHQRIAAAIKAIDPEMLVAEGVFVPRAVAKDAKQHAGVWPGKTRDERYPPMLTTIGEGALDFLDVHFYRTSRTESVDQAFRLNLASSGFFAPQMTEIRKEKPVILGEFGAFNFVEKTFEEAVDSMVRVRDLALKEGMNGMLYWTYDSLEQPRLYHAASDWALFVRKLGCFEIGVRKPMKLPGMVIDFEKRCVDLEASVCLDDGFLELVACRKGSKEHESIVAVAARPMHIHTALLLLGANNGNPALRKFIDEENARWVSVPPQGDAIGAYLVFQNAEGKMVERPVSDFIKRSDDGLEPTDGKSDNAPDDRPQGPDTFLFAGSLLKGNEKGQREYLADSSGNVISIVTFGDELLCLPEIQSHDNGALSWQVDSTHLPKVGTSVTLRLRPKKRTRNTK